MHASDSWYNEIKDYDFNNPENINGKVVLHFTQMIWKDTKKVGFGVSTTFKKEYNMNCFIVVANYEPKGNWIGSFKQMVPKLINN